MSPLRVRGSRFATTDQSSVSRKKLSRRVKRILNAGIKGQVKYRFLIFRPLCGCGGRVSVHSLIPGHRSEFGELIRDN